MSKGRVLFQLSGSIACFKACHVISRLVQDGFEVETVATSSALEFVGLATLEGLTGRPVHTETFAAGEYMQHIHLVRWADLVILCPASANTLAKMAAGVGDDLLTTLFLAHDFKKPYLIAPAMNATMLQHPATQAAIRKLVEWGVIDLGTGSGPLACGEVGDGRLLEPDQLYAEIVSRVKPPAANGRRILITSGGTREPIDGVRSIANTSTGRTGAAIATRFAEQGHDVTLLRAEESVSATGAVREITFSTFQDLERQLRTELGTRSYDDVIHAAAVSDYSVTEVTVNGLPFVITDQSKIESSQDLAFKLRANPKLVDQLKAFSRNPKLQVVAFKLTNGADAKAAEEAVRKLAEHSHADLIVHNDLREVDNRSGKLRHNARIFHQGKVVAEVSTKLEIADALAHLLAKSSTEEKI